MTWQAIVFESAKITAGAIIGVLVTTWYKDFKEKKNERKNLFLRMVSAKSFIKIPQSQINDMNMIEVLFRHEKKIILKYQLYYAELCAPDGAADYEKQKALYWDLLREMGNRVGYKHLDNKVLNTRYIPKGAMEDHISDRDFRNTLLNYLTVGIELQKTLIDIYNNPPSPPAPDASPTLDEPK